MMSHDDLEALVARLGLLRKQRAASAFGLVPASIGFLESKLAEDLPDEDRHIVYTLLVSECSKARNDALYMAILRRRVCDFPEDPMSQSGLAFGLALIEPSSRTEALRIATESVTLAKKQDRLVRYCATNLARIAMMFDDYVALRTALLELVDDAVCERTEDIAYEFDFVDRIDPFRCGAELLAKYRALS